MSESNDIRPVNLRKRGIALALACVTAGTAIVGAPRTAHAEEVSPDGKGIAGGALIGAELVVFIEALAGVRSGTAYALGAAGGAVAGGAGGFGIEKAVDDGRAPVYLLAGGLALVIPALVVALDATRFRPNEGAREDKPADLPPSDPGKPGGSAVVGAEPKAPATPAPTPGGTTPPGATPAPAPATPPPAGGGGGGTQAPQARAPQHAPQGPSSLFNYKGGFYMGVPVPEVRPSLSASERNKLGVQNPGSELRFPVVNLTF